MLAQVQVQEPENLAPTTVGYSWYFENITIYGPASAMLRMLQDKKASRYGEYLGVVYGEIPTDPYRIVYQWVNSSPAFKQREALRSMRKRVHISGVEWRKTHMNKKIQRRL